MSRKLVFALIFFRCLVSAKRCTNLTVPVDISARNAVFSIPSFRSNLDATTFAQNLTSVGGNFSQEALKGYATITGQFNISAKFCQPDYDSGHNRTVQVLTHGIGFDKTYWDLPFDNFEYSYVDVAVDQYGYSTLSIDRLGIGNSSVADPVNIIQLPAELSALLQVTSMLRDGTLPSVPQRFTKIVNVGHSFGSLLSYALAATSSDATDGLVLTGFSFSTAAFPATIADFNSELARLNQPLRFGNLSYAAVREMVCALGNMSAEERNSYWASFDIIPSEVLQMLQDTDLAGSIVVGDQSDRPYPQDLPTGYLTWADAGSNQFAFLHTGFFDPRILQYSEAHKMPYTVGELLTLGSIPTSAPSFEGPVQIVTGNQDFIFCGGDCMATGDPILPSIPAAGKVAFPAASAFEAHIQPNTGHAINLHYNATGAYKVIHQFLDNHGLASS